MFFFSLSKSLIKSSLKLLKFLCRFEFLIALCFPRERNALFETRLHFADPLSIKESRNSSKINLVMFSSMVSFTNLNTSSLPHLVFGPFNVSIDAIISTSIFLLWIIFGIFPFVQLISNWKLLGFLIATNVII